MDIGARGGSEADLSEDPVADPVTGGRSPCRVAVLGDLWVEPGLTGAQLGSPKQRELLAVLALHSERVVTHDALAEALWEGAPPRTYAHSLQLYVSALRRARRAAGSSVDIETHRGGYRLAVPRDDVDLNRFRRLVEAATADVARERWEPAAERLAAAMSLWRGPCLAELAAREFAAEAAASADALRLDGLESQAVALAALGEDVAAARSAEEAVAADPLRERARGVLMLTLHRAGRTAEALRAYEDLRTLLDEELGAVPSVDLRRLHERILRHDDQLLVGSGPAETAAATAVPEEVPPSATPRSSRRRMVAAVASVLAVLAATVVAVAAVGDRAGTPRTALLIYHGGGEVNMSVEEGFDRAVTEFGLVGKEVVAEDANAALTIDERVSAGALVLDFTIETDSADVARRHRDVRIVALDDQGTRAAPNLTTIRFASHEVSYLAGYAAARTTTTGTVGFVGGVDYATIWPFEAGFVAGVRAADPTVDVLVDYLSAPPRYGEGFEDPVAGQRAAHRMYDAGADVVFAAAGASGLGVFEAATTDSDPDRHLWAIGVDADQYETVATLPGTVDVDGWRRHILTSAVLRFDRAVYASVAAWARDELRPGLHRYDLAKGGVELSFSGGYLEDVRAEIDAVRRSIVAGEVAVPCRPARLPEKEPAVC